MNLEVRRFLNKVYVVYLIGREILNNCRKNNIDITIYRIREIHTSGWSLTTLELDMRFLDSASHTEVLFP